MHLVVGLMLEGAQQHAAPGVERRAAGDVGVAGDERHDGAHFRFRDGKRPGPELLEFLPPARREIAVEIESLFRLLHPQRVAIPAFDAPLGQDTVIGAAHLHRIAPDHQPRLLRMVLPEAVGVGDAHLQDAAVAVDVLDRQAFDFLFVVRVRTGAGTDPLRLVGERPFGAVRVDPRANVEGAGVEGARDVRILAVLRDQRVQEIEAGGRGRDFGRVDVAVDPERGLLRGGTGGLAGDGQHPDVAAFETPADRLDRDEIRVFGRKALEDRGEVGVAVEAVESDGRHAVLRVRSVDGAPGGAGAIGILPAFGNPRLASGRPAAVTASPGLLRR